MPPSRTRSSEIAASRRRINRTRELWIDLFRDALNALIGSDEDRIKELSDDEAEEISTSAARIADRALAKTEERFPGL